MTRNDDFDPTLAAWLRGEAPPQAPDRVLDTALQRVAVESQRRSWLRSLIGESQMTVLSRTAAMTAVVVLAAVIGFQFNNLVGNFGDSPSPTVATTPSASASLSLRPTATLPTGCRPEPDLTELSTYIWPESDPLACWGDSTLSFDAERIPAIVDCFSSVEPAWLACSQVLLQEVGEAGKVGVAQLIVAIDPARNPSWPMTTAVRITGHFDDPAAETCREADRSPAVGGTPEPAADIVERCRRTFVVTQVLVLPLGD